MNEVKHFFDMEIKRTVDCITNDWVECFNGIAVGNELVKKFNREHIVFCKILRNFLRTMRTAEKIKEM